MSASIYKITKIKKRRSNSTYQLFFHSFCDGFLCFPAIQVGSSICDSSNAAVVLELIEQLFFSYTYWNYVDRSLLRLGVLSCFVELSWWLIELVDNKVTTSGFYQLIFDFSIAGIPKCCWMWIPWLHHVTAENVFDAHSIHQYIAYSCMHWWAFSITVFRSDRFQGANSKEPTIHAATRIWSCRRTGIGVQVHRLWRWICKPTRCWLSPPSPHMRWHGVCRPKQHPITFSDRTPGSFGWNSSPAHCCASRWVNVPQSYYILSANHIL